MTLLVVCVPRPAAACPFMLRHGSVGCGECRVDPSGAGVLTDYGRGQSASLLSSRFGEAGKPGTFKDFLFLAVDLPDALGFQVEVRQLAIPEPGHVRLITMQADLRASLALGPVLACASAGGVSDGAEHARVTGNDTGGNVVSREHGIGVRAGDHLLLRGGSLTIPYGVRGE